MDLLGGGSKSMQAGRLFAVLWLFCASFAMQFIAVGQSVSSRVGAGAQTGNVTEPDTGSSDRPVARQVSRAVALPDFRFVSERADGKSMAGGDPSPVPVVELLTLLTYEDARPSSRPRAEAANQAPLRSERIRGPPLA
ncbi:hypothetical protein PYH37_002773 [Sinorhizobium numidicum]|uniref:Transmembrane protein n=1 Tax=Sinorhizobium numidicum TaxID=680248 RepID=A0ABY8D2L8_9HYPH|nr:hypothetical protein [Sinorhizobium numidicum]WEX77933.1 hypothetical protein PYH37_002773 [Sinorhizobium numidicum]WEX84592.1 hypothetical protein PYH38_003486 [Sinorhizobium numidicum]